MDAKTKHLEMIQAVITRMASNSFLLKGWSVVLVSAMFALGAKEADKRLVLLAYFPALMFWVLDGFFLRQERLFRALYDRVRTSTESVDFSMSTSSLADQVASWPAVMFSTTLVIFHGVVFITILVVMAVVIV